MASDYTTSPNRIAVVPNNDLLRKGELLKYFRHKSFRPGQKEALLEAQEAFLAGKKYVISELPTGTGKSDIAMTMAMAAADGTAYGYEYLKDLVLDAIDAANGDMAGFISKYNISDAYIDEDETFHNGIIKAMGDRQSFIVTSQKPLQTQYLSDFGYREKGGQKGTTEQLMDIRGKSNYQCEHPKGEYEQDCHSNKRSCLFKGSADCNYVFERLMSQYHPVASTNSTFYAVGTGNWLRRELSVIDECHNSPDDILNLVSFTITDQTLLDCGLLDHLFDNAAYSYKEGQNEQVDTKSFIGWVESIINPLTLHVEMLTEKKSYSKEDEKMLDKLEQVLDRATRFLETTGQTEWIVEGIYAKGDRKFVARPLDSGYFAYGMFFNQSKRTALQSATITDVNKFAEDMGLKRDQFHFIQKPSPFPLHNRPVFNMNTAKMGYKDINDSLPELCKMIQYIIDCYPVQKGIIHCQTYKLQDEIVRRLRDNDRIICPGPGQREAAIKEHLSSTKPTVLISPSMTEGIDLKGELARFAIVCKLPFPYLGDRRIKIKTERDKAWYQYQTSKTLVQSVGRGVRSETDWCHTYILDAGFGYFARNAPLPPDFLNSVQTQSEGEKLLNRVKQKYSR